MDMLLTGVTLVSVVVALVTTTWAVRLAREARRRSDARVAMLEQDIAETAASTEPRDRPLDRPERTGDRSPGDDLFASGLPAGSNIPRIATAFVMGLLLIVGLAAAGLRLGGTTRDAGRVIGQSDHAPLELTSLRHDREGDEWSIVGLVRNPPSGTPIDQLTAVAFLFDETGAFLSSGRAPLEFTTLAPGTESPFSIRITTPDRVARYRVGFRTSDGSVIRHIDRRPEHPRSDPAPDTIDP